MTNEYVEVTPDPERIAESLRDTGYNLNTAIADIVDNSIAAGASRINLELVQDPRGRVRFSVADNGCGMDQSGLANALRYGSSHREDPSSLGKFGLGLKTASTAFARRIRITSRATTDGQSLTALWDLDRVKELGWQVQIFSADRQADIDQLDVVAPQGTGTVVRWESVDRVIREYKDPTGTRAKAALQRAIAGLREHLAMIFQRFLDPEDSRAATVSLSLNGESISAWNPFGFGAECLLDRDVKVETESGISSLKIRAFVLPRKSDMQAALGESAHIQARLANKWQGIYVYRENRLIHGPDWLNMWSQEPHLTLARAELSFDHALDDAFQVDIKKSAIVLDSGLIEFIERALTPPRREAQNRYRDGQRSDVAKIDDSATHGPSNAVIGDKGKNLPKPSVRSTDAVDGSAQITNPKGTVSVPYRPSHDSKVFIEGVDELTEGLLYKPSYIGSNPGVLISKSHPYYRKVYVPNRSTGVTVQALDSLLWALAAAEFRATEDSTKEIFEDIRFDVSRALRKLVEDLPEPDLEE